jgi:hypothetical protein
MFFGSWDFWTLFTHPKSREQLPAKVGVGTLTEFTEKKIVIYIFTV